MTQSTKQTRNTESGFTLVELAIVMIIIGLLIGGILKGQELITNARVSSTVAQVKAMESGISGFRDKYAALPGDIGVPATRLSNCAGACATAGAGGTINNGLIEAIAALDPGAAYGIGSEAGLAFIHLGAAGFIGGVQPSTTGLGIGVSNPTTPLGGAWSMASSNGAITGAISVVGLTSGIYVVSNPLVPGTNAVPTTSAQIMTPSNAANIDRKLDDGSPLTGSVRAVGAATGAGTCTVLVGAVVQYAEQLGGNLCGVAAKVQ